MTTPDKNASVRNAVDTLHRVIGRFHALLSVLQEPLAVFVTATCTNRLELFADGESIGLKTCLQRLRAATCEENPSLSRDGRVADVDTVLRVLKTAFDGGDRAVGSFDDGCAAVLRLLEAVYASEDALSQAHALMVTLGPHTTNSTTAGGDMEKDSSGLGEDAVQGSQFDVINDEDGERSASVHHAGSSGSSENDSAADPRIIVSVSKPSQEISVDSLAEEHRDASQCGRDSSTATSPPGQDQAGVCEPSNASKELRHCLIQRDYGTAVYWLNKELECTREKTSRHAELLLLRAQCRFEIKQYVHVHNDCQAALAIDKSIVEAYHWATLALIELDRLSEAHSMCHAGRKIDMSDFKLKALEREISRMSSPASVAKKKTASVSGSSASRSDNGSTESSDTATKLKISIAKGIKSIEKGEFAAANVSLTEALKKLSPNATTERLRLLGHRARCLLELKRFEAASDDALDGLKIKADWVEGHRLRCKALMGLKRWQEADVECQAVLRRVPQDAIFQNVKKTITAAIASSKTPTSAATVPAKNSWIPVVKALVKGGLAHVERHKYVEGDACFSKALLLLKALDGSSTDAAIVKARVNALGHRARCRLPMESYANAVVDARAGIKLQPDWIDGYRLLCLALMGTGQWIQALTACKHVMQHVPGDTVFPKHLVKLQELCSGRSESQPVASPRAQFDAISRQVIEHLRVKEYELAASSCSKAIALLDVPSVSAELTSLQKSGVFINRARCWIAARKYVAALQDVRTGLSHNPQWAEAYRLECVALMGLSRWREAKASCEQVLERVPTDTTFEPHMVSIVEKLRLLPTPHPSAPVLLAPSTETKATPAQLRAEGVALMALRDREAAESKFSAAIALLGSTREKKLASYFGDRSRCRVEMKKFEEALEDARASLVCDPEWTEGFRLLCRAFMGLDQWLDASKMCERVLAQAPQDASFLTIKTQIDSVLEREKLAHSLKKKGTEIIAPVHKTPGPSKKEDTSMDKIAPPSKGSVSAARIRELEQFALNGSVVAQRFLSAQDGLQKARARLRDGRIEPAFAVCRYALRQWPQLDIPRDIADELRVVGMHAAIQWGGVMLYFHLQATGIGFSGYASELDYWKQRVERYPQCVDLRIKFASVLYRGHNVQAALEQAQKASQYAEVLLLDTGSIRWYLRAMCLPVVVPASPLSWLTGIFSSQPEEPTRGSELLTYIQRHTVDDEWMPHACYSLGVLHLNKKEYVQATQFYFLANEAEIRRAKLRLFPDIDDKEFPDKTALQTAVTGPNAVLSLSQQYEAVKRLMACTWCNQSVAVSEYFEHKLEECIERPKPKTARVSEQVR